MPESRENRTVVAAIFRLQSVCDAVYKTGMCGTRVFLRHGPIVFSSSLVKSHLVWFRAEKLEFEAKKKKYFCTMIIHKTTIQSLKVGIFAHFVRLSRPTDVFAWCTL